MESTNTVFTQPQFISAKNDNEVSFHKHEFNEQGFTLIKGKDVINYLGNSWSQDFIEKYWNNLELDKFMTDGGTYRQRRFGRYKFDLMKQELMLIEGENDFYQSKQLNHLNGGIIREFAPVDSEFAKSETLNLIVKYCLSILPINISEYKSLSINTHLFRVICTGSGLSLPTPEGIHRDGHSFVSQHLISKNNIHGGISGIYDNNNSPILHRQLYNSMDTIIIDDTKVKHDVSPVLSMNNYNEGYRDMLIIDYNFE